MLVVSMLWDVHPVLSSTPLAPASSYLAFAFDVDRELLRRSLGKGVLHIVEKAHTRGLSDKRGAKELSAKLAADIAALTAQAEAADREADDPQALPAELGRREALKAKLDDPAPGWRPKHAPKPRRRVRTTRRRRPPMMPIRGVADLRRNRRVRSRARNGRAT